MKPTTADRLRRSGERATPQRLAIASALADADRLVTALEVYDDVRRSHPGLGRATVFRALEALVASGVARRLERDSHVYGYVACRDEHHHHLACDRCGRVEDIGESHVAPLTRDIERERGFRIDDARVDFYGTCADCLARAAS